MQKLWSQPRKTSHAAKNFAGESESGMHMPQRPLPAVYRGASDMRRFEVMEARLSELRQELSSLFELVLDHRTRIEVLESMRVKLARRSRRSRRKRKSQ